MSADLYVLLVDDRNTGLQVYPFIDPDNAIRAARRVAESYGGQVEEEAVDGRLYHANLPQMGDTVRVVQVPLMDGQRAAEPDGGRIFSPDGEFTVHCDVYGCPAKITWAGSGVGSGMPPRWVLEEWRGRGWRPIGDPSNRQWLCPAERQEEPA